MGYGPPIMEGPSGDTGGGGTGATGPTGPVGPGGGQAIYGDAHMGDVVYTVDTQLDATVYANDITVQAGVTLDVNEWPIYARGTFLVEATAVVHGDGVDGNDGAGPDNNYAALVRGGQGGGPVDGSYATNGGGGIGFYRPADTGNGGSGGDTSMFSGGSTDPDPWWNMQRSVLGGGSVITNGVAGSGNQNDGVQLRAPWAGGSGGGGGAWQAGNGGRGGQAGGPVVIACKSIVNNGVIRSQGGDGEDATDASGTFETWDAATSFSTGAVIQPTTHAYMATTGMATGALEPTWTDDGNDVVDGAEIWRDLDTPQAGGGGGGQGGNVILVYDVYSGNEPTADGGLGGSGLGAGTSGSDGDDGHVIHLSNV